MQQVAGKYMPTELISQQDAERKIDDVAAKV